MQTRERFQRMYEHKEADRVPIIDIPWAGTIRRWQREGMPVGMDWRDYFDVDKVQYIGVDITPRYEEKIIEETDRYVIRTTPWGVTLRDFKMEDSTPEYLDYKVTTPEIWEETKKRMTVSDDRINWKWLKENFDRCKAEGQWMSAEFWFGFDVTHSHMVGTDTVLIAMMEEPEFVMDMFNTYLESCMALHQKIWDAGYHVDEIYWPDDMGYKGTTFFSPKLYREVVKPYHQKAAQWAHDHGIYAHMHSCGDVMTLVPDILDAGIDCLNPLEIKAGMDPIALKKEYGDRVVLHGGINAVLWDDADQVIAEVDRLVPPLKENGGFIFSSDHSIPNTVTLDTMKKVVAEVKRVGTY